MLDGELEKNKELKTLRTYTSDMADAVRENEASVIKIALAEKEKREQEAIFEDAKGTRTSRTMYVIGGMVFILIAVVSIFYLFYTNKAKNSEQTKQVEKINTFFVYDSSINIDAGNASSANDIVKLINEKDKKASGLEAIFLEKKIGEASILITSSEFLHIIDAGASSALVRSLGDNFLLGKYTPKGQMDEKTFLVFEISNYSQVYASMLSWEKSLAKDLNPIFKIEDETPLNTITTQNIETMTTPTPTSETTTPNTTEQAMVGSSQQTNQTTEQPNKTETKVEEIKISILDKPWKDMIINNRDARALVNDKGEGVLFYTFLNKDKLIITDSVNVLRDLITRLLNNG